MINGKTIKAIIPARMTSSRLPGKVLMPLDGRPALQRMIERVRASKLLDGIVIACTTNKQDDPIVDLCNAIGCEVYRGSENDVLDRIIKAARTFNVDVIMEATSDCPLLDYHHIDYLVGLHMQGGYDLTTNILTRSFPRGYDIRIVDIETLERSQGEVDNDIDKGHCLTWMYLNPKGKDNYRCLNWLAPPGQHRPDIEVTLDTPSDYELINWLFMAGREYRLELTCQEVIELINIYPDMYAKVKQVPRKDYFQELWDYYAKQEPSSNNTIKERNVDEGANLQSPGDRSRKSRKRLRPARKRKPA